MKTALVLSGGGARGAYQVGVLKGIAELFPETKVNPFQIICGTSAGAINASKLAVEADQFHSAVIGLERLWSTLNSSYIHKVGYPDILRSSLRVFMSFFHSGIARGKPLSLFNNAPLLSLLQQNIDLGQLGAVIKAGHLHALCINALGYTSGNNIGFFQGHPDIKPWRSARRIGVNSQIDYRHLMASSALPAIFPAVHINREYFGDGALRQSAPLSAALHLGADKLLVIGVSGNEAEEEREKTLHSPTIGQVLGHMLNSAFIDSLEDDVEMLQRFNGFAQCLSPKQHQEMKIRPVEVLVIKPSIKFDQLAADYIQHLPQSLRFLLSMIGANRKGGGASLASYLLFEKEYCQTLITCGYQDALSQAEQIRQFIGVCNLSGQVDG